MSQADSTLALDLFRINWKKLGFPYCGLYIIVPTERRPLKIGISAFASDRLNCLQSAHWRRLLIGWYRYCGSAQEAQAVEKKAHSILRENGKILSGEWFDVAPKQAVEAITFSASVLGVGLRQDIPTEKVRKILLQKRWLKTPQYRSIPDEKRAESWFEENQRDICGRNGLRVLPISQWDV